MDVNTLIYDGNMHERIIGKMKGDVE